MLYYINFVNTIKLEMKILVAPDSFKESLSSKEACQAIVKGIIKILPNAEIVSIPLSDGGEGMIDSVISSGRGKLISITACDPLMRDIESKIGVLEDKETALIEVAAIIGLHLLKQEERNPMITSSYGVGQLIKKALDLGYRKIIVGLGGSSTNDGGIGMLTALGVKFLDKNGQLLQLGTASLEALTQIDLSGFDSRIMHTEFIIACDVVNPFVGNNGASFIYGPQKGATPEMVAILDSKLNHFSKIIENELGVSIAYASGAGAAGGLGGAFMAFFNATLKPGFSIISELIDLEKHVKNSNLIISGEGKVDAQTLSGKVVFNIGMLGKKYNVPVVVFGGSVQPGSELLYEHGVSSIVCISSESISMFESMKNAKVLLEDAVERTLSLHSF
jgi:glycerate kinase